MKTVNLHEHLSDLEERKNEVNAVTDFKATKNLDDVKADMSELYEQVKHGAVDLKLAGELANITGKYLKAAQLELAREIFLSNNPENKRLLPNAQKG